MHIVTFLAACSYISPARDTRNAFSRSSMQHGPVRPPQVIGDAHAHAVDGHASPGGDARGAAGRTSASTGKDVNVAETQVN